MVKISPFDFFTNSIPEKKNSGTTKTIRTFQTDMTDSDLSERNIAIVKPCINDDSWVSLFNEKSGEQLPFLRPINMPKTKLHVVKIGSLGNFSPFTVTEKPNLWRELYDRRIGDLREIAKEEEEEISDISASFARNFLEDFHFSVMPSIFRSANGNVRLVWDNEFKEQVALQFRPDKKVQYVIFRMDRGDSEAIEQILGIMTPDSIIDLIYSLRMSKLAI